VSPALRASCRLEAERGCELEARNLRIVAEGERMESARHALFTRSGGGGGWKRMEAEERAVVRKDLGYENGMVEGAQKDLGQGA
jgi:hypothetical protein